MGFGYPAHSCYKPHKPYQFGSEWERDSYIRKYNQYIDCINEYVENGNNDIQRIQEKQREAIAEAESRY